MRVIVAPIVSLVLLLAFIVPPAWPQQATQHIILTDGTDLHGAIVSNDPSAQRLQIQEQGQSELRWIPYNLVKAIIEESTELDVTTRYIPEAFLSKAPAASEPVQTQQTPTKQSSPSEPAPAQESGRLCYIRASVGYGAQALDDVNNSIRYNEQTFQAGGVPVSFDTFNGAPDFGGEIGFRITRSLSLGVGVNYQKNTLANTYSDNSGIYTEDMTLELWDVSGNISYWFPGTGFFLGGSAGMAFGNVNDEVSLIIYGDSSLSYSVSGKGDGKAFAGAAFAGYQVDVASGPLFFAKFGYAFRNLGNFDGTYTSPEFGSGGGTVLTAHGDPMEFDFSGVFGYVGIGITFGKSI